MSRRTRTCLPVDGRSTGSGATVPLLLLLLVPNPPISEVDPGRRCCCCCCCCAGGGCCKRSVGGRRRSAEGGQAESALHRPATRFRYSLHAPLVKSATAAAGGRSLVEGGGGGGACCAAANADRTATFFRVRAGKRGKQIGACVFVRTRNRHLAETYAAEADGGYALCVLEGRQDTSV